MDIIHESRLQFVQPIQWVPNIAHCDYPEWCPLLYTLLLEKNSFTLWCPPGCWRKSNIVSENDGIESGPIMNFVKVDAFEFYYASHYTTIGTKVQCKRLLSLSNLNAWLHRKITVMERKGFNSNRKKHNAENNKRKYWVWVRHTYEWFNVYSFYYR